MDPFQLPFQRFLSLRLLFLFFDQALLFLLQPRRVVALPGDTVAAIQLQNPAGHVVQKVAVVGHGDDRALVVAQVAFQPGHRLGVEVVGRLVQQQDVRLFQQQAA